MEYETLHGLWDAWSLVFLLIAFVGLVAFVFRKGAGERYRRAARIPMRDEDPPGGTRPDETRSDEDASKT